jgi:16S rRNA (uracil1498-N3)-methyltransferase
VRVLACPALTKGTSFDAVVEAATELGAHVIAPMITARCIASVLKAGAGPRLDRWRRITIAAAKQCGRIALPELMAPAPLDELLASLAPATTLICAAGSNARPLLRVLEREAAGASAIAVLVGPEADFTPEEVAAAVEAGAHVASLGPTTLRSPAATAYALGVVSACLASR